MARKAAPSTSRTSRVSRASTRHAVVKPVSHFPVPISIDALKGPAPTPKRVVIPDFYGPGQPGQLWYLPTTANFLVELGEAEYLHEIIQKVRDKLAKTIVNQDGTPLMTPEQWGEIEPDRLLDVNQLISRAIGGMKRGESEPNKSAKRTKGKRAGAGTADDTDDTSTSTEDSEGNV